MASWKVRIRRFDPYGIYLRSLEPGRTLEIGCGIGRNLDFLRGHGLGVDHNEAAIHICRQRGLSAWTPEHFPAGEGDFDSLLFSHVLEHLHPAEAVDLIRRYIPRLRRGGRVIIVTPQERGYASDPTHVTFVDFAEGARVSLQAGLTVMSQRSFPPSVRGPVVGLQRVRDPCSGTDFRPRGSTRTLHLNLLRTSVTPATEEMLVEMARVSTAAQLEKISRGFRRCRQAAARGRRDP